MNRRISAWGAGAYLEVFYLEAGRVCERAAEISNGAKLDPKKRGCQEVWEEACQTEINIHSMKSLTFISGKIKMLKATPVPGSTSEVTSGLEIA